MRCEVAREALSARIDGERETVPSARVDEHLDGCAACTEWYAAAQSFAIPTLRSPVRLVSGSAPDTDGDGPRAVEVDPRLVESVLTAMRDQPRLDRAAPLPRWWWVAGAAAAVAAVLLVVALVSGPALIVGPLAGLSAVIAVAATVLARRATGHIAVPTSSTVKPERFTVPVTGMHCQGCVQTITENLTSVNGVVAVAVDLDIRGVSMVHIDATSAVSESAVARAISSSGNFDVPS